MHKLTNATVEIIEAMASNAYNGMGDKRSSRVHQVKADSSIFSLEQKMDMLVKHMEIVMKAQVQMMTPMSQNPINKECGET